MNDKVVLNLEYPIKCSPRVLFNRLSTASGLSEWFADDVRVSKNVYTFVWDGSEQKAELVSKKDLSHVKFKWLDEENAFFEFRLNVEELTGDLALIITDCVDEDEQEGVSELWESQVNVLKQLLGI
ncbi:MAG TPA: START-like domain-containing protein [Bacteroidales bacterium]|jgi:hypothetical protein|nr:START-like domain-containing protein [Bacteroidales bacterium]MDD4234573.1 START-like domain-containing protein [Bacteroidales bacterium]MDY0159862.1 START-like domain-containing protein [Bacteroidales bacterium]HXK82432.1 START-like domain-containing protein [Bacteroidales bacterium]